MRVDGTAHLGSPNGVRRRGQVLCLSCECRAHAKFADVQAHKDPVCRVGLDYLKLLLFDFSSYSHCVHDLRALSQRRCL